jgi:hypothetical protein
VRQVNEGWRFGVASEPTLSWNQFHSLTRFARQPGAIAITSYKPTGNTQSRFLHLEMVSAQLPYPAPSASLWHRHSPGSAPAISCSYRSPTASARPSCTPHPSCHRRSMPISLCGALAKRPEGYPNKAVVCFTRADPPTAGHRPNSQCFPSRRTEETGLPIWPSEKKARNLAWDVRSAIFSGPVRR